MLIHKRQNQEKAIKFATKSTSDQLHIVLQKEK